MSEKGKPRTQTPKGRKRAAPGEDVDRVPDPPIPLISSGVVRVEAGSNPPDPAPEKKIHPRRQLPLVPKGKK